MTDSLDKGNLAFIEYLDIAKAFFTVEHKVILLEVENINALHHALTVEHKC